MSKPAITIVMPCYNASLYIKDAISSILSQSFEDFEFIIINDGSVDTTDGMVRSFNDKRIVYITDKVNKGNYHARNRGLKMAKGEFICVMDADDISYENRLYSQYNFMITHPNVGICGSLGDTIDEFGTMVGKITKPVVRSEKLKVLFLMDNYILHPSLIMRKSLLFKFGLSYNTKYNYASDYDFVGRCFKHFPVVNVDEALVKYRLHNAQISISEKIRQSHFANQIRLARLNEFGLNLKQEEKDIYLKLINNVIALENYEKEKCITILNKILFKNEKVKLYRKTFLYNFFDFLICRMV